MTEQSPDAFKAHITPVAGWFITVSHPLVVQRFYAAIDCAGALCWTDNPAVAEQFPQKQDAVRFAKMACPDEDWRVTR